MEQQTNNLAAPDQPTERSPARLAPRLDRRTFFSRNARGLLGLGALAAGAAALLGGTPRAAGQEGDDDDLHEMTGQGGQLDALTYPPPASSPRRSRTVISP